MHLVAQLGDGFVSKAFGGLQRVHHDLDYTRSLRPFGLGESLAAIDNRHRQEREFVFLGHAENAVLEREHVSVVAAVTFGEHRNRHVVFEALFHGGAHAQIFARVPVHRNAADFSQDPAEHGNLPEFRLRNERGHGNRGPNHVDVQKTLVVRDKHEFLVVRDVFLAYDFDLNSREFEKHVKKRDAHAGAVGPAPAKNAFVEHEGDANNE